MRTWRSSSASPPSSAGSGSPVGACSPSTGIFAGVALVGGAAVNPDGLGILMALGSATAYAVYILLSDRLLRDADPMALTALLTAGASTSFLVAGAAIGTLGTVGGPAGLACLGGAALVGSVFAVSSFLKGVRLVGPSTASLLVTVEVPVTIALAAFVLKQHLTPAQLAGAGARRRRRSWRCS